MIVVSDSSALVALSFIHRFELLRQLYGEVTIPEVVWQEVVVASKGRPGGAEVLEAEWVKRRSPANRELVAALRLSLDSGEAAAIALALELEANLLIMDERRGRKIAHHWGLDVIGVIGILMEAKRRNYIDAIKPCLDQLRDVAGFRISNALYQRILRDQGER